MTQQISDREVRLLASIAVTLEADYVRDEDALWTASPFAWIRSQPSRTRGKIGEQLVSGWCAAKGLDVTASRDSEADRVIGGHRIEVKSSTLWSTGVYKFQQIRDQRYEYVICLGISPFDAHCWVIPKSVVIAYPLKPGVAQQHGGRAGRDTFWLSLTPSSPPAWLASWGGPLSQAFEVMRSWM